MSGQVLITKSKLNSLASKINNIVGETDKKTLDQMSNELTEIDSEIATQEDLIAQLQQAVDNLPDKDSGSGDSSVGYQIKSYMPVNVDLSDMSQYSLDDGLNWIDFYLYHDDKHLWLFNVSQIKFRVKGNNSSPYLARIISTSLGINISADTSNSWITTENFIITKNIDDLNIGMYYESSGGGSA